MNRPRPIATSSRNVWQTLRYVFTDIDDTLTTDGQLTADVYQTLEALSRAGVDVIPVTGRPAGWCDMIARFWPVRAVVGENGAFYFRYDRDQCSMVRVFADDLATRRANTLRLETIRDAVLAAVPEAAVAADQAYRHTDLAIDFAEDVPRLSDSAIDEIVEIFHDAGAVAKVSSIHINGWFGEHNKSSMTNRLARDVFDLDIEQSDENDLCAFIGDSPNDAEMFGAFGKSVGVANLNDLIDRCEALPTWTTIAKSGAGFREFAELVLSAKRSESACNA
jgi:HAD superfamily hydrolase (TIGR01484 family)